LTGSLFLLIGFFAGCITAALFYRTREPRCFGERRNNKPPRAWPVRDSHNRMIAYDRRFHDDRRKSEVRLNDPDRPQAQLFRAVMEIAQGWRDH